MHRDRRTVRGPLAHPPGKRRLGGVLSEWLGAMSQNEQESLFDAMVMTDLALRDALPTVYPAGPAAHRLAVLLLHECARSMGLEVGELAMLVDDAEGEARGTIEILIESQNTSLWNAVEGVRARVREGL